MVTRPTPAAPWLRDGHYDDLDDVMAMMESAFRPCFGERWTRSQCAGILPLNGVRLRLAGAARGPARGFSLMRIVADEAELLLIAVAPEARRAGLGQALIDDFIQIAKSNGAIHLHLEVRDGNPAIALYFARGFSIRGRRHDYYHGPGNEHFDALTLILADQI